MGLFGLFKGKEQATPAAAQFPAALGAAAKGEYVPMEKIPDEMFSQGIMGVCCGVEPSERYTPPLTAKSLSLLTRFTPLAWKPAVWRF